MADFVFGTSMTVTGGGQTQTATRAGSQIVANAGAAPGAPTLLKQGSLGAAFNQLEGATSNDNKAADQSAQKSGFSGQNSGQPVNAGPNGPPNPASNTLVNAVSNAAVEAQQGNTTRQSTPTAVAAPTIVPTMPPIGNPTPPTAPLAGPPRTSQTVTGFAAGLVEQQGGHGGYHSTRVHLPRQPGEVTITTDAANSEASATLVIRDLAGSHSHSIATLQLGGTGGLGVANSAFVDDRTYAMITQANDPSRPSTLRKDGITYPANDGTVLASAAAAPLPLPLQGTPGACACEFLTWGWWAASVPHPTYDGKTYTALGTYVAGKLTTAVQMPQTGSATYSGFMTGIVNNRGNTYAGAGSYQNAWNFGARTGAFNGTFDGRGYSGTTQAAPGSNGQTFTGSFSGSGRSGSLNGAFFASPSDAAAYQAGTFAIGNGNSHYKATGIFAGQR